MCRSIFVLAFASFSVLAQPQNCAIPGELVHWQMAYCMSVYETDDPAHPAVDSCFNNLSLAFDKQESKECQLKQQLAGSLCLGMLMHSPEIGSVQSCIENEQYHPTIVIDGGI